MVECRGTEEQAPVFAMVEPSDDPRLNELRKRIEELNKKSTQVLMFAGIGMVATVLLWSTDVVTDLQQDLLMATMRWWALAILPAVAGILPLKEIRENNRSWYRVVRWSKFLLLWLAILCIVVGTTYFIRATLVAEPQGNTQTTMLTSRSESAREKVRALTQSTIETKVCPGLSVS